MRLSSSTGPTFFSLIVNFFQMEVEEKRAATERQLRAKQSQNPLEPLLIQLARDFSDDADLSERLRRLYKACPPTTRTSLVEKATQHLQ